MSNPSVQIAARGIELVDGDLRLIRRAADRVLRQFDRIVGVRVVVRAPHRRLHREIVRYFVTIHVALPQGNLTVRRVSATSLTTSIHLASDRAVRRLQDYVRRQWRPHRPASRSPSLRLNRPRSASRAGAGLQPAGRAGR